MEQQIITIEAEDTPGILMRIASLFSRRGFNITSLTVSNTHKPGISSFTIVFMGDENALEQLRKQSQKLIHVISTEKIDPQKSIIREFSIVKINKTSANTIHINRLIDLYGLRVLFADDEKYILEIAGSAEKLDTVKEAIGFENIIEFIRTGKIAVPIATKR